MNQIEEHYVNYQIVEMENLMKAKLPSFLEQYEALSKYKDIGIDLFWELYKDVLKSDYTGSEYMKDFSQANHNMLTDMKFKCQQEKNK